MSLKAPLLLCLFLAAATCSMDSATESQFKDFIARHGKFFSPAELPIRRAAFVESLSELDRMHKLNPNARFALNEHADLSSTEWRRRFGGGYVSETRLPSVSLLTKAVTLTGLSPPKVDWRQHGAVDPTVFDQGECGCCWSISASQTIGSQYFLANASGVVPSLSFQQLICCDCGGPDAGCHGGDPHLAYRYVLKAGGLESNNAYPFTDAGPDAQSCNTEGECKGCRFNSSRIAASIKGYENVTQADPTSGDPGNETALAEAVARDGPLSVCIDSDSWRFYSDGVLDYGDRKLNHCVQLVGYDTSANPPYWILKNSWGKGWGEQGFIRMSMGMDVCGVADVVTRPLV